MLTKSCLQYLLWAQTCAGHLTRRRGLGMLVKEWWNVTLTGPGKRWLSPGCTRKLKVRAVSRLARRHTARSRSARIKTGICLTLGCALSSK